MLEILVGEAEDVVHDLDLAVTARAGPYPDRWNADFRGYIGGEIAWNQLQDHSKRAR